MIIGYVRVLILPTTQKYYRINLRIAASILSLTHKASKRHRKHMFCHHSCILRQGGKVAKREEAEGGQAKVPKGGRRPASLKLSPLLSTNFDADPPSALHLTYLESIPTNSPGLH